MDSHNDIISFNSTRRFGVEIELNTSSDVIQDSMYIPDGSEDIARIIRCASNKPITLKGWLHVNNNEGWVVKPDSTCGIEINSPVLKGRWDLLQLCHLIDLFNRHPKVASDSRCSFHVHVNLEDFTEHQIGVLLAWCIKCEGVFFDMIKKSRKVHSRNQLIGMTDLFSPTSDFDSYHILNQLGGVKYYSINCYHMKKGRRKSVEFRMAGNDYCTNPLHVKNYVRLLLLFCDTCKQLDLPKFSKYPKGSAGLRWIDHYEFFKLLKFNQPNLSEGLIQIRDWILDQWKNHAGDGLLLDGYDCLKTTNYDAIRVLREKYRSPPHDFDEHDQLYNRRFYA